MSVPALARRARYRAVLERDLRRFRRRHGEVFAGSAPSSGPVALIVSLTSFPYQLKLEGMLAKALELDGCVPVIAALSGSDLPRRYFECFGLRRLVDLAAYANPAEEEQAREKAGLLLAGEPTVAAVKELRFRGIPLGRYVLSTASRLLHASSIDPRDPETRGLLERLAATAVRSTFAAERLVADLSPALAVFNERNYASEAPLCDVALRHGVNVIQWVGAFQEDGVVFKRYTEETKGMHPRSLSDESWERVRALEWTTERQAELDGEFGRRYEHPAGLARLNHGWTRPYAPGEISARLGLDPAKRTAVLFSHILWDANMFFRGKDLFPDQEEWFVQTVRAACENERVNWIVKLHPGNVWKLRRDGFAGEAGELRVVRERVGELPPHVALMRADSDVSARSVFELADWGITIRGSVGVELPCFGVPVLTAGSGFYSGRGFTVDSGSAEEYLARIRAIDEVPPLTEEQTLLARRHAYALFRLRPVRFTSFTSVIRPLEELGHPLDHDLVVNLRSRAELERAEDLRAFARWAVGSRDLDYLAL